MTLTTHTTLQAECLWETNAMLGESPVWVAKENALYWLDIKGQRVFRWDALRRNVWHLDERPTSIGPCTSGKLFGTFADGFGYYDLENQTRELVAEPEHDRPGNRFNDGKIDPWGRYWAGTMDDAEVEASGHLYCFYNSRYTKMDSGYTVSNGPCFSPDLRFMYHTDSPRREIYRFDLDRNGTITNKTLFLRFESQQGFPDGMTCDEDGNLWVAQWGGFGVSQFSLQGELLLQVRLPVAQVTSCAFGGEAMNQLFITTASVGLDENSRQRQPLAGSLFVVETESRGRASYLFNDC